MHAVRPPAVSGMFYTDDPAALRREVATFLDQAKPAHHTPKALIAPHAGYVYSGPVAGSAYAALRALRDQIRRVVLLGPAHRVYVPGIAASSAKEFATPLGSVPVDQSAIAELVREFDFIVYDDNAHALEHSLEVQLPFLQSTLTRFDLLPFAVGGAHPVQVERLLQRLWGGSETLIVISSDLSHYHDYDTAKAIDRYTSERIEQFDPAALHNDNACGQIPIRGLLRAAVRHGLRCEVVDLRNSGDTAGPRDRVVGYGAYLFYPPEARGATADDQRRRLTTLARDAIAHGLDHDRPPTVDLTDWPEELRRPGACFVTLKKGAELRGCIGTVEAHRPLVQDISENAYAAAFQDPRFPPLRGEELAALTIHLSVLSPPRPIEFGSEQELLEKIRPGVDGLILSEGQHRGTFLPSVWEQIPERNEFLAQLKRKAGLAPDYWSSAIKVERYETESW